MWKSKDGLDIRLVARFQFRAELILVESTLNLHERGEHFSMVEQRQQRVIDLDPVANLSGGKSSHDSWSGVRTQYLEIQSIYQNTKK